MAGGFWGGLAEGVESGQGVAQRQQALSLQQQQMQQQAELQRQNMALTLKKYLGESAEKIIDKNVGEIDNLLKIAETAVSNGKVEQAQKLGPAIQAAVQKVQKVAGPLGLADRIPDFSPRFEAILGTTLTPMEQGGKQGMVNLGQQATENAGGLPAMKGSAQGAQAQAAATGEAAGEVIKINTTADPKAAAAAKSTTATTSAQIKTEAANAPAIQTVSQARSAGQTTGEIQARTTNLQDLANVEATLTEMRERARQAAEGNGKQFERERQIAADIRSTPQFKAWSDVQPVLETMRDAVNRDTKASDLNLVYGMAKIFDPGSVVREGEQILVNNTASLPDWLVGRINSVNGGARLTAETRANLMSEAESRAKAYGDAWRQARTGFERITQEYKLNPRNVIPDVADYKPPAGKGAATQAPAFSPGAIVEYEGKRYRIGADGKKLEPL